MTQRLGYDRFGAAGADWGAFVTGQLAHAYPELLLGVHGATPALHLFNVERPWADLLAPLYATADPSQRAETVAWERARAAHLAVHTIDPQTLAHALHDSPAGLAAWLLARRRSWSACADATGERHLERRFSREFLLTTVMIYWVTGTIGSSMRFYFEANRHPWVPRRAGRTLGDVPVGLTLFGPDRPPGASSTGLDRLMNRVYLRERSEGGHFTAAESPEALVEDIRATFRPLRT